ncbi:MAG: hypothetical protein HC927_03195 [Deltaproteobacteria bacterium]|nr:hypothetical protein [Deltaproteobacteria bacterium]
MSGPQSYYVLLSLNVWQERAHERNAIYVALARLGLQRVDPTADSGVYTTFFGSVIVPENFDGSFDGQLEQPAVRIDNALHTILHGCGYIFMWGKEPNFGGPAYPSR